MEVDGLIDSEIMQILPVPVAEMWLRLLRLNRSLSRNRRQHPPVQQHPPQCRYQPPPQHQQWPPGYGIGNNYGYGMAMRSHVVANVPVQPAQFTPLNSQPVQVNDANIGTIPGRTIIGDG